MTLRRHVVPTRLTVGVLSIRAGQRLRWRVAVAVNRCSRHACWAQLVSWYLDLPGSSTSTPWRLRDCFTAAECARDMAGGTCYCGQLRHRQPDITGNPTDPHDGPQDGPDAGPGGSGFDPRGSW